MPAVKAEEGVRTTRADLSPTSKVLVAEDESADLQAYSAGLKRQGYAVQDCASSSEALRSLDSESFDFIVVSQRHNSLEGHSLTQRATETHGYTPVLVLRHAADRENYRDSRLATSLEHFGLPLVSDIVWLVNTRS